MDLDVKQAARATAGESGRSRLDRQELGCRCLIVFVDCSRSVFAVPVVLAAGAGGPPGTEYSCTRVHVFSDVSANQFAITTQSFDPRRLEVEIETPRGVSHTFSPVKSEFAFDKLVLKDFVAKFKYTSLWQTSQYQSRRWAGDGSDADLGTD